MFIAICDEGLQCRNPAVAEVTTHTEAGDSQRYHFCISHRAEATMRLLLDDRNHQIHFRRSDQNVMTLGERLIALGVKS